MQYPSYKLSFKNQFRTMASLTVYRTGRQQCSGGFTRGEETRDFYLIHHVMHGRGVYMLNGQRFPVCAGQAFLIYPHMRINYIADMEDPWEYCWVGFNGADAGLLMNATRFTPQSPVITLSNPDEFQALLLDIYRVRGSQPHEILRMTAGLYQALSYLVHDACSEGGALGSGGQGILHVQQACDYIAAHYTQELSVEDIAAHLGLCRSQLYRVFKRHTGISPQKYITEFRIREACSLLSAQSLPIREVAFAVGFWNPLYFSQVFKASIGQSPSEYVKNQQAP